MEFKIEFDRPAYSLAPFERKKACVCLCAENMAEVKALFTKLYQDYHYRITDISIIDYRSMADM